MGTECVEGWRRVFMLPKAFIWIFWLKLKVPKA